MQILVTGGAGFIGSQLTERLLQRGDRVTVLDNFDPYYDPAIKRANLAQAVQCETFSLVQADIRDAERVDELFRRQSFDAVVHLAALAGVRLSIEQPQQFVDVNVSGTLVLLEAARRCGKPRFVLASTSSVYGLSQCLPFREDDPLLTPVSPYGATKIACEKLGHIYHSVHGLGVTSLRFFTAYGPRQRPDMAIHSFARAILAGEELTLYGDGSTRRDYTYIDDIVGGIVAAIDARLSYDVINLGNGNPVELRALVEMLEAVCGRQARVRHASEQPGDVPHTCADISHARDVLGYEPLTPASVGIPRFVEWLAGHVAATAVK
jgi:UDP-glucuronate 4-epimerase